MPKVNPLALTLRVNPITRDAVTAGPRSEDIDRLMIACELKRPQGFQLWCCIWTFQQAQSRICATAVVMLAGSWAAG